MLTKCKVPTNVPVMNNLATITDSDWTNNQIRPIKLLPYDLRTIASSGNCLPGPVACSEQETCCYLSPEGIRHGESRRDPTVSVDHVSGQSIDNALDRISNILGSGDDHAAGHQESGGEEIVHAKNRTISHNVLILQVVGETTQ